MKCLETDLDYIADRAAEQQDAYEVLLYQLQWDDAIDDSKLDAYVEAIAAPIRAAIDCTQCANCCLGSAVCIVPSDITRLAKGIGQTEAEITAAYVANPETGGDMTLCSRPCKLLDGLRCSVYAHRPQSCRDFPAFAPDFRWILAHIIKGATICPIIYHVLDALIAQIDYAYPRISLKGFPDGST